jgi:transposase
MGVSAATGYKWWARWRAEGNLGLQDRSSRPHRSPTRTPRALERRIERLPEPGAGLTPQLHRLHRVPGRPGRQRALALDRWLHG